MYKRRARRQPRSAAPPRRPSRPPGPGAWSLLIVNSTPLRQQTKRAYEKVLRDLESARLENERFHAEDQPLYSKWLNANFGALLTANRELQARLHAAQSLVLEVQDEYAFSDHRSMAAAYKEVMHRRTHPEEYKEEPEEGEGEEDEEDEEEQAFRDVFEAIFGETEFDEFENPGPGNQAGSPGGAKASVSGRIKELYRTLARRLHPDSAGERSAKQIEWWHQTQAAYEAGDANQLEVILTMAEIEERGTKDASVSVLQQITRQFKHGLNALRRELRLHREDPAWDFSSKKDLVPLSRSTRLLLESERYRLETAFLALQAQIDGWQRTAERKRRRRRTAAQDLF